MGYKSDIEIAQEAKARPINEIAGALGFRKNILKITDHTRLKLTTAITTMH